MLGHVWLSILGFSLPSREIPIPQCMQRDIRLPARGSQSKLGLDVATKNGQTRGFRPCQPGLTYCGRGRDWQETLWFSFAHRCQGRADIQSARFGPVGLLERNDSVGYVSPANPNNIIVGSLMCGGSSGGPWLIQESDLLSLELPRDLFQTLTS